MLHKELRVCGWGTHDKSQRIDDFVIIAHCKLRMSLTVSSKCKCGATKQRPEFLGTPKQNPEYLARLARFCHTERKSGLNGHPSGQTIYRPGETLTCTILFVINTGTDSLWIFIAGEVVIVVIICTPLASTCCVWMCWKPWHDTFRSQNYILLNSGSREWAKNKSG